MSVECIKFHVYTTQHYKLVGSVCNILFEEGGDGVRRCNYLKSGILQNHFLFGYDAHQLFFFREYHILFLLRDFQLL